MFMTVSLPNTMQPILIDDRLNRTRLRLYCGGLDASWFQYLHRARPKLMLQWI